MIDPRRPVFEDLTVVIPTLGRDQIEACLDSLASGTGLPGGVIVVDQGSNERIGPMVAGLSGHGISTRYIPSATRGRAAGLNRGIAAVSTRFVIITDDDCVPAPDWLELMHARLMNCPGSVITGRVLPEGGGDAPSTYTSMVEEIHTAPLIDRDVLFGGNMGAALDIVASIGHFDEDPRIGNAEDGDWAYRALRAGVAIVYAPEVVVVHTDWRSRAELRATYRGYARSQGGLYGKYIRRGHWFMVRRALFDVLRGPWMVVRGALQRNEYLRVLGMTYVRHLVPGIVAGLRAPLPQRRDHNASPRT